MAIALEDDAERRRRHSHGGPLIVTHNFMAIGESKADLCVTMSGGPWERVNPSELVPTVEPVSPPFFHNPLEVFYVV
jgi:hypothetical protein